MSKRNVLTLEKISNIWTDYNRHKEFMLCVYLYTDIGPCSQFIKRVTESLDVYMHKIITTKELNKNSLINEKASQNCYFIFLDENTSTTCLI